jgi:hypothetical protein
MAGISFGTWPMSCRELTQIHLPATPPRPGRCQTSSLQIRGRRECRTLVAPAALRAKIKARKQVTTVTPETPGIPRAMVLTVSFALSLVIGLCCHHCWRDCRGNRCQRDASVEASRPYDFAVRFEHIRRMCRRVHRISCPTFVTIARRPSCGQETRGKMPVICPTLQAKSPRHVNATGKSIACVSWVSSAICVVSRMQMRLRSPSLSFAGSEASEARS